MSESQLKRDLHRRTRERMERLVKDTFDLYDMAELDSDDAKMALADVLLRETAALLAASGAEPRVCGAVIGAMVKCERGEISVDELARYLGALGRQMMTAEGTRR